MRLVLIWVLAATISSCSVAEAETTNRSSYDISLIQILADPSNYVDTSVTLFGYLAEPDFPAIYLIKDHYEADPLAPRLIIATGDRELEFYKSDCMFQYVTVSGQLVESKSGRIALADVSRMTCLEDGIQPKSECGFSDLSSRGISKVNTLMEATILIPSDGYIENFEVSLFILENGEFYHPSDRKEMICLFDAMFDAKTKRAFRKGLKSYAASVREVAIQDRLEHLWHHLNGELDALYVESGLYSGTGIHKIRTKIGDQINMRPSIAEPDLAPIQKLARKDGIFEPNSVSAWGLIHYLESFGVEEFQSDELFRDLREFNLEFLPD